jgi:hypothetical protein
VKGDFHARFCERRRVGFPPPTHLEAHSGGAHRSPNLQAVGGGREGRAGILSAAIGVEYRTLGEWIVPGSHGERIDHQFRTEMVGHGVSDAGLGITVDDGGEIQPTLPSVNVSDVSDHFLAGSGGGEVPIHQIRDRAVIAGHRGGRPPRSGLAGDQVEVAHQLPHELGADLLALTNELGMHATVPIGLIGMIENRLDQPCEVGPANHSSRGRPVSPFIISRGGHLGPPAHLHDGELCLLRVDELEFRGHRDSWAKKAAAFPKKSAFIFSSRFSFSSSRKRALSLIDSGGSSPAWSTRNAT